MVLHLGGAIPSLTAMCDSDFAADLATRYSTGGHIIYLGCGPVVWYSKRQTIIAHSTAEAEYIALTPTIRCTVRQSFRNNDGSENYRCCFYDLKRIVS